MYEVWASQGQGGCKVKEYKSLKACLNFIKRNEGSASFGVKYPDGTWHKW